MWRCSSKYICAMDNFCYNQYFLVNNADGLYYRIPWDLDYSLGIGTTNSMNWI